MKTRFSTFLFASAFLALLALRCLAADQLTPVRHDFPKVGGYEVLSGDFHMHTINSDGKLTTRQRVEESYKWGYDAIAVTDHGKSRAYSVARSIGEKLGMVILCGFESGIVKNEHLVVLGVPMDYKPRDSHRWAENPGEATAYYRDEMAGIAKAGGLLIYAHPHVGYREPVKWGIQQGIVQGIELKNGVVGEGWNTVKDHGTSWYPSAVGFAMENNLAVFANSDVHGNRAEDTSPVTLLLVTERSPKGVMDAIKGRRTAAWFSGMLWGREELLGKLIMASVKVSRTKDGGLDFENRCPIALKATVGEAKVELAPYGKASLPTGGKAKTVFVTWDNVWTDLQTNLRTIH